MANIHVVPTFHHDIAYLQPESVYTKMATDILDKALTLMEQDETYTFTVEQAYFFREYFEKHPEKMPGIYKDNLKNESVGRCVCDFLSSMTDRYAINLYKEIFIPSVWHPPGEV